MNTAIVIFTGFFAIQNPSYGGGLSTMTKEFSNMEQCKEYESHVVKEWSRQWGPISKFTTTSCKEIK